MSTFKRYLNFVFRTTMLLALITATATLLSALVSMQIPLPSWVTPTATFITLFVGSLIVFERQEKQVTSRLVGELMDHSGTFHNLTMAGSGENREIQLRFLLDRVQISDRSKKDRLEMRGNHIKTCHNLIERWFRFYHNRVEFFMKQPKSIDANSTAQLVDEFKEIVSRYMEEVINPSIDFINETKVFPKDLKERFETKFDAFKSKYNYFGNQFNDYIKRLNKDLSYKMEGVDIISKSLELEFDKPVSIEG